MSVILIFGLVCLGLILEATISERFNIWFVTAVLVATSIWTEVWHVGTSDAIAIGVIFFGIIIYCLDEHLSVRKKQVIALENINKERDINDS